MPINANSDLSKNPSDHPDNNEPETLVISKDIRIAPR